MRLFGESGARGTIFLWIAAHSLDCCISMTGPPYLQASMFENSVLCYSVFSLPFSWLSLGAGFMPPAGCLCGAEKMATAISQPFPPGVATSAQKGSFFPKSCVLMQDRILKVPFGVMCSPLDQSLLQGTWLLLFFFLDGAHCIHSWEGVGVEVLLGPFGIEEGKFL